jgi:hypothetical protein
MKRSDKRLPLWIILTVCLLAEAVVVFRHFNKYVYHLPVVITEPKLVPSGGSANPFVGHIFANYKEDGKPSHGKDSISMDIDYTNTGSQDAYDMKRSVITVLRKDNKLMLALVDTSSFNTRPSVHPGAISIDEFYLPNFLPADTQYLYVKFDYHNKAGVLMEPLREMFNYNQSLMDTHLPSTDGKSYADVKALLVGRHLW